LTAPVLERGHRHRPHRRHCHRPHRTT